MIENFTKNLSKVELMSYLNYGSNPYYKNFKEKKDNNEQNEQKESAFKEIENIKLKSGTNPFDTFEKSLDEKIQLYFNKKYEIINKKVREITSKLSKKGKLKLKIDSNVIEVTSTVAQYLYNSTLPENNNYIYSVENNVLYKKDKEKNTLLEAKFSGQNIFEITTYENNCINTIYFRRQGLMESLLRTDLNKLQKFEKKDSNKNLIEKVEFSKNGAIQCYSYYANNKLNFTLSFDLNCPCDNFLSPAVLHPLEYTLYEEANENKIASLSYAYSRPAKYSEFSPITNKLTKFFMMQGLDNLVYKYAFYDELNGILTQSGNL